VETQNGLIRVGGVAQKPQTNDELTVDARAVASVNETASGKRRERNWRGVFQRLEPGTLEELQLQGLGNTHFAELRFQALPFAGAFAPRRSP